MPPEMPRDNFYDQRQDNYQRQDDYHPRDPYGHSGAAGGYEGNRGGYAKEEPYYQHPHEVSATIF